MGLLLKFAAGFAIAGLIISLAFGFIGGNRPTNILVTALICTLVSAAIGAGVCKFLEQRVPELFAILDNQAPMRSEVMSDSYADDGVDSIAIPDGEVTADDTVPNTLAGHTTTGTVASPAANASSSGSAGVYGDHIVVNKVKIKNEPKLIAAAIRTLLAKDDK
ncbi:MAG: hypothetical protein K8S54_14925 [Spirochaetia bacterium]|nr:hypothetical protein [Spirochaetia bacterium]